jgi:hypothetical protein
MEGLTGLRRPEQVAKLRGLSVDQVLGLDLQREAKAEANGAAEAPVAEAAPAPEAADGAPAEEPSDG